MLFAFCKTLFIFLFGENLAKLGPVECHSDKKSYGGFYYYIIFVKSFSVGKVVGGGAIVCGVLVLALPIAILVGFYLQRTG